MNRFNPFRFVSLPLALLVLLQSLVYTPAYGLSGGPIQPEFQQTNTVGADNLVDPFSGNFNYSIPLMEVGGFPLTLSYSSDHKMEEEASWVGFGWTLNPGAITRQVRGLPDDFRGEEILRRGNMAPSVTTGITPGADFELFGAFNLGVGLNFSYNNYSGFHFSSDLSPSVNISKIISPLDKEDRVARTANGAPFLRGYKEAFSSTRFNAVVGTSINSRTGMENLSFSGSYHRLFQPRHSTSFGGFTYTPVSDLPQRYDAVAYDYKFGNQSFLPDAAHATFRIHSLIQGLSSNSISQPAYGYLYLDASNSNKHALQDYNKDQGGLNLEEAPRIPMAYGTPDSYSISGPGLSGQIKVSRNDLGLFRSPYTETNSTSTGEGVDFAPDVTAFPGIHLGYNINRVNIRSKKGEWAANNDLYEHLKFAPNDGLREGAFMHMVGESTNQMGKGWYNLFEKDQPIFAPPGTANRQITLGDGLVAQASPGSATSLLPGLPLDEEYRTRRPRAQQVTYLTAGEAAVAGLDHHITSYNPLTSGNQNYADLSDLTIRGDRVNADKKAHHISEVRVTNAGGQRFVYGLPVYNLTKKEVTFNASGLASAGTHTQGSNLYGLIKYGLTDNSPANDRGRDNFFDEVTTGAYATAHLLTGILSPDYVDRLNDGPSYDDLGQFVKFNYSQVLDGDDGAIGWRTPSGPRLANFNPGNLADDMDDRASYTYGEKEVYYLHHVDSKTHRAIFLTSDREDALPSQENGGNGPATKRLQKLDQIKLFTHAELQAKGAAASPIKTVHFTYDEDNPISGDLPNSTNGDKSKLTLKSVHFTYADNERGQDNPYQFSYKTDVNLDGQPLHVSYQPNMTDRWGNQVPVRPNEPGPQSHPYSIQDAAIVEAYCDLGNLTNIQLPSGGKIAVNYEPDDYAYVQDKRAGRMYEVLGFSKNALDKPISNLHGTVNGGYDENLFVHIEVPSLPMNGGLVDLPAVKRDFFEDVKELYFEARVELTNSGNTEKVTGYANIDRGNITAYEESGIYPNRIVVRLEGVSPNGDGTSTNNPIHPITFAGMEKMRLEMHRLTHGHSFGDTPASPEELLGALRQSGSLFKNYYQNQLSRNSARKISTEATLKSYARLAEGSYKKYGDGSRVRTVSLTDEWLAASHPDQVGSYIQRYSYTTTGDNGEAISSGVAANEPMIGKEEMLMVGIQKTSLAKALAPNESYYTMWPVGLTFFPGPQIGYSKVSMSMEIDESYEQSKPGRTAYEFYTARDFPVITNFTEVVPSRIKPNPQVLPFASIYRNRLGLSQGYSIEVNDMHGKMKQTKEFDHYGTPISSSLYRYKEKATAPGKKKELDNLVEVSTGNETGDDFTEDYLGMDMEMWFETTANTTRTEGGGAQANLEFEATLPFPLIAGTIFPSYTNAETGLYTAVTTKLISRYGILEEVEVVNNGSSLSTNNLRWDALTGAPILTSTENEFDQPIYSHNLPARFIDGYEALGPAYLNEGTRFKKAPIHSGRSTGENALNLEEIFFPGDELYLSWKASDVSQQGRAHVMPDGGQLYLTWDDGTLVNPTANNRNYDIIIIRSGRRNMLGAPAEQTAGLTPPNAGDYWDPPSEGTGINETLLQASAVEYADVWSNMCLPVPDGPGEENTDNCENEQFLQSLIDRLPPVLRIIQGECEVNGFDWQPYKEDLIDCDKCFELYDVYARRALLVNIEEYQYCSGASKLWTIDGQDLVANCDFIKSVNPHLLGTGSWDIDLIRTISPDAVCFDEVNCSSGGELKGNLTSSAGDPPTTLSKSITNCFPWSSTNPIGNPYLDGRRGNWRLKASYVAKQQDRNKSAIDVAAGSDALNNNYNQPLLFKDGTFDNFLPFWSSTGRNYPTGHIQVNEVKAYDDHGHDLETADALGIPSAAQYGFFQNLPTAVAQNSKRTDMAFDGFEDYAYQRGTEEEVWTRHFSVIDDANNASTGQLTDVAAHTGLYSLLIPSINSGNSGVRLNYATSNCTEEGDGCDTADPCSCIHSFAPAAAQKYQVSLWVARTESLASGEQVGTPGADEVVQNNAQTFSLRVRASVNGSNTNLGNFYPSGPVIDGWQRITAEVELPENASILRLRLVPPTNVTVPTNFYVDDLRIHPYESSMVTYAYNPFTLRLMAQMDDNGYAVFYEYDDEGQLIRQKRETERGIMTITEQHTNLANTNGQ